MRWRALFEDLEAQLAAARAGELDQEVRDRTRRELALVRAADRLAPAVGHQIQVQVLGHGALQGRLLDVGPDWVLLDEAGRSELLLPWEAVLGVTGLGASTRAPGSEGTVEAALGLQWALRGLARSRAAVQVGLRDGSMAAGTLDRVGTDHLELAEHPQGEARRAGQVQAVRLLPLHALALLRRS